MARSVAEWRGKNDDAMPPKSCYDRLWDKQGGKDAITGIPFAAGDRPIRDHIIPLADGGENRETNLQLITLKTHKLKTAREAQERAIVRTKRSKDRGYVTGKKRSGFQTNRDGKFKQKMNGEIVVR